MPRTIEQFHVEKTIKVAAEVRVMQIAEDLYLYREQTRVLSAQDAEGGTLKSGKRGESEYQVEGFIDEKGRAALSEGRVPEQLRLLIVSPDLMERLRTQGFYRVDEELFALQDQKPWEIFQADLSISADNLVRIDYGNHMVFDYKGSPQPSAVLFDYMSNRIDESRYDLRKLADYLMKRPDIEVYEDIHDGRRVSVAETIDEAIYHIPSYNAEEGSTLSIQFSWKPTKEDYTRACALVGDGKVYAARIKEAVITNDLLGISPFKLVQPRRRNSI